MDLFLFEKGLWTISHLIRSVDGWRNLKRVAFSFYFHISTLKYYLVKKTTTQAPVWTARGPSFLSRDCSLFSRLFILSFFYIAMMMMMIIPLLFSFSLGACCCFFLTQFETFSLSLAPIFMTSTNVFSLCRHCVSIHREKQTRFCFQILCAVWWGQVGAPSNLVLSISNRND